MKILSNAIQSRVRLGNLETTLSALERWVGKQYQETTMRYQLTPVRMAITKKATMTNAREGLEIREASYTVAGTVNWCSH